MPRIAQRGRLSSFAIALVLLGTVLGVQPDRAGQEDDATLAATTACADVLLVLVPGNGEGAASTPVNAGRTMGRFQETYLRETRRHGRSVELRVIPFRTQGLGVLRPSDPNAPANRSITAGLARKWQTNTWWARNVTLDLLAQRARACPDQSIVLGGYGQGAGVVHLVLRGLGRNLTSRRIIGAALFSDPYRSRNTSGLRWGEPPADGSALGILPATRVHAPGDVPFPDSFPRVLSVCRKYDVVCDYRGQRAWMGIALAGSYYSYDRGSIDRSALDLAVRTRAIPDPRPPVTQVAATVGTPVRRQLVAEALPRFDGYLRWVARSPLPPGMTLNAFGVLSGTPTKTGTFTVDYRVRNVEHVEFNRPIPGTLVVKVAAKPTAPPPVGGGGAAGASAGGDTSCVVPRDGSLWCWGDNYEGQVGIGNRENQTSPQRLGSTTGWVSVDTGGTHTCAVRTSGALWCWGRNDYGQVGDGSRTRRLRPVRVGGTQLFSSVATNTHHTCAIGRDDSLWCWGLNDKGQLGIGSRTTRITPARVGSLTGWASVSTGAWHTCAMRTNGSALCWGGNQFGQLGRGDTATRLSPVRIGGPGDGWGYRRISAGDTHSCAITSGGQARCWGANTSGQVGDGTRTLRTVPVAVADGTAYRHVDAGLLSSCGVTTGGQVRCWGAGWTGGLGAGGLNTTNHPRPIASSASFRSVEAGWGHTCATESTGSTWCWGLSSAGQIGKGGHTTVRTPVRVLP